MGKVYERIEPSLAAWMARQPMFFVGSAPSGDGGHVNVSPKGPIGTFAVLDPRTVAYLDLVGSGAETVAHLRDNGRIVIMFCAFSGPPRILRLHGRGEVLGPDALDFPDAPELPEAMHRAVIRVDVERIADSCGYGVPLMRFEAERENTLRWAEGKLRKGGPDALAAYRTAKNARSIDGLPALEPAPATRE